MSKEELLKLRESYQLKQKAFRKMHLFQAICLQKLKTLKVVEIEDEIYESTGIVALYNELNKRFIKAKRRLNILQGMAKNVQTSDKLYVLVNKFKINSIDSDLPEATDIFRRSISAHIKRGFILDKTLIDIEQTVYVLDSLYASSIDILQSCVKTINSIMEKEALELNK